MQDMNFIRALHLLERIKHPDDLIGLWKSFNGYNFTNTEVMEKDWWSV